MKEELAKTVETPNPDSLILVGPQGIIVRNLGDLWRFAEYVMAANLGNATLNTPHKIVLAAQRGLEVGLTLMQSMSNIYVVNNLPTLYGDVVPGLVRSKGNCKYIKAEEIGEKPKPGALLKDWPFDYGFKFTSERSDTKEILPYEYTVDEAKQAKLWEKSGSWTLHPKRMLRNRCRTFCLRDLYPDALGGMYTYEEMIEVVPEKESELSLDEKMAIPMRKAGLIPENSGGPDIADLDAEKEVSLDKTTVEGPVLPETVSCSPGALEAERKQREGQTDIFDGGNHEIV